MKSNTSSKINNEHGMISISVTVIIMIIVTLIVSSFSLIVRRQQSDVLDRQLSTQAFYAAELGVQDASDAITKVAGFTGDITDCTGNDSFLEKVKKDREYNPKLFDNVEYSCVLINRTPGSWKTQNATPEAGAFIVPINTDDTRDKIRISWQDKNPTGSFETNHTFNLPQGADGLNAPMLEAILMPAFDPVSPPLDRDIFENNSHTMFLYPQGDSLADQKGTIAYKDGGGGLWSQTHSLQGAFVSGMCNKDNTPDNDLLHCNVEITGLDKKQNYYLYIKPMYKAATISISGFSAGDTNPLPLEYGQAEIDATGKAGDVLRRVQARIPVGDGTKVRNFGGLLPLGALVTSDSICKKYEVNLVQGKVIDGCGGPDTTL